MSWWWQKKLLRYVILRSGILDEDAIDLDGLNLAWGRQSVFDLKDVGLNVEQISKLTKLPPSLRVETARILSLRLTVPADFYQSSIAAEVDGVEVGLRLEEQDGTSPRNNAARARSPVTTRSPQHRKMHRRLHSPPPHDPGSPNGSGEEHLPTTEEMARSFLMDEPLNERRELEAVAAQARGMEESIVSESSEGAEYGTGAAVALPGFLAGFLKGVIDRVQIRVKNVHITVNTQIPGDGGLSIPVSLKLHVGDCDLPSAPSQDATDGIVDNKHSGQRPVKLSDIYVNLLSEDEVFSELSEMPSRSSPATSRHNTSSNLDESAITERNLSPERPPTASSRQSSARSHAGSAAAESPDAMEASIVTADSDRFADAGDEGFSPTLASQHSDLDIQPGDDNISWSSRRNQSSAPTEDLWNSMASEDDLPDSLLLDRASTPRAPSTRSGSPAVSRSRREVSPYSRQLQSPGSWPRMEESQDRISPPRGPGSWPNLDQSQHGMFESLNAKAIAQQPEDEDAQGDSSTEQTEQDDQTPPTEDLTASRVFSHDEAESMFMSAMSHRSMHVPGGWASNASAPRSPTLERRQPIHPPPESESGEDVNADLAYGNHHPESSSNRSGQATPRASSPIPDEPRRGSTTAERPMSEKRIFHMDTVSVWLPILFSAVAEQAPAARPTPRNVSDSFAPTGMPGTFSAYSEMSASRHQRTASFTQDTSATSSVFQPVSPTRQSALGDDNPGVDVEVGTVSCQLDMSCCRLLYRVSSQGTSVLQAWQANQAKTSKPNQASGASGWPISISVQKAQFALKDRIETSTHPDITSSGSLLALLVSNINVSSKPGELEIQIGTFETTVGGKRLLSFDKTRDMRSSMMVTERSPDLAVKITDRTTVTRRAVKDIGVETMPIVLSLDLAAFDETFSSFGGFSGVLEAGNSMLSDSGLTSTPASPRVARSVRFESHARPSDVGTEIKLNGRIGGLSATLQGETCAVQLKASTLKTICREQGASVTIDQVSLSGPYKPMDSGVPMTLDLTTIRLDYLTSPQERDLDRLLSLLTPSKDKYDNDDDILIDTLLRQRRKGAVVRVAAGEAKANVSDWASLSLLQDLGNEMSKLSAVAKYLPEDDRPGLLSVIRIKSLEARLPVNERFGKLHVDLGDVHCAHVGLPALFALAIGNIRATQNGQAEIVHSLMPTESLPMVMMRMLGDEVEPVVKVKLYNLCAEYSVPVLLAATGLNQEAAPEEVVAELTQSIANFAMPGDDDRPAQRDASQDDSPEPSKKKTTVELLVHDSAVGLQPQKISSKGMLVLTNAHFSTFVPPEATVTAQLQLRQAGVFVADEVRLEDAEDGITARGAPSNTATSAKLTTALARRGFVSVGSIAAAQIGVKAMESTNGQGKSVDVDVKNELLLLETCADSTQTLIAVLNGLAPPTPPSKQPKYLTEPMTIEDMMASFSGEPQVKEDRPPETLFDAETDREDENDGLLDMPPFDEEDEDGLLAESEMEASLYGPVSGMLEGVDKPEDGDDDITPETAESLLEDDPFEMPDTPADTRMSDAALVRELNKQCKPSISEQSIDLGLWEIEDLGFDALGGSQQPLGTQHRFNTPASRRMGNSSRTPAELPFKLRLRDLHIIWNIYDGYDWRRTREGITEAVEQVEQKAEARKARRRQSYNEREEEESVIGDFLFNSIYIGVPGNNEAHDLRRQINRGIDDLASETESVPMSGMSRPTTAYSASGRPLKHTARRRLKLERSRAHKVAFELKGVSADILVFPPDNPDCVSSVNVRVKDFEIFDKVPSSTWHKFLTHLESNPARREMSKPMMHIELLNVKTLEQYAASEIVMHVAVLPLRLHVDQDALDFITRFFEFKDQSLVATDAASEQPFLQRVEVDTVDMCLDYKPKRVDYGGLRSGHYTEFKNFVILEGANIKLKHAIIYGIKGFEPLHQTLNDVWMPDIKRNQLPTVLAGLAPVRSLVNIGSGVRDVVAIPVREYRKDGRIVRSIQKGAMHFGKTTTSELARLGAKVAMGTQTFLSGAEGLLSPATASPRSGSSRRISGEPDVTAMPGAFDADDDDKPEKRAISAYANQPLNVFSGLRSARRQLELDLLTAKDALIAVQGEMMESANPSAAVGAVARHAPTVILRPVIGASRAVGTALLGVGNQIDRGGVRRVEDVSRPFISVRVVCCSARTDLACRNTSGGDRRQGDSGSGPHSDGVGLFLVKTAKRYPCEWSLHFRSPIPTCALIPRAAVAPSSCSRRACHVKACLPPSQLYP